MVEDGDAGCYFAVSQSSNFPPATIWGSVKTADGLQRCNEKSAKYDYSGKYLTVKKPPIFLAIGGSILRSSGSV